jgi:peptidoglycan/LPS O-acetylase OafA/YrhL
MRLARISLLLAGLAYAGFGILTLAWPRSMGILGVELTRPAAVTEIRAFYGGLELGMALFFFRALRDPAWHRPALFVQAASLGGVVLARLFGIVIDGSGEPLVLLLAAAEGAGALLGFIALRRLEAESRGG